MELINTINVGIIDDMKQSVEIVEALISNFKPHEGEKIQVYTYTTPKEIIVAAVKIQFDIVFMDIDLGGKITGINIAAKIKEIQLDCLIIYISGYTTYYPQMVKNELFGFLEKPLNPAEFYSMFEKALQRIDNNYKKYMIEYKGVHTIIRPHEIIYAYSRLRKCGLVMDDGQVMAFYKKLDDLEKELNAIYPYFIRVNKSVSVNYMRIKAIERESVTMDSGEILSISKTYRKEFHKRIFDEM